MRHRTTKDLKYYRLSLLTSFYKVRNPIAIRCHLITFVLYDDWFFNNQLLITRFVIFMLLFYVAVNCRAITIDTQTNGNQ